MLSGTWQEGRSRSGVKSSTRGMVYEMEGEDQERFPVWMSKRDRRLLQRNHKVKVDSVVALDGSGNFKTIQAAVNHAPLNSTRRYVIHIKTGIYDEHIRVPGNRTRLTFIGDGPGRTIITGNKSTGVNKVVTKFTATLCKCIPLPPVNHFSKSCVDSFSFAMYG